MSSPQAPGAGLYALDSSVLVASLRGDQAVRVRLMSATLLYVPSIALGELFFGAYDNPTRPSGGLVDVDALAAAMVILGVDVATARTYGRIKQQLKRQGQMIPDNDLWIAATAIRHNLTLAARDVHFN